MPKVPAVSRHEADKLFPDAQEVTSVEVKLGDDHRPILSLSVGVHSQGKDDGRTIQFVLSPPAAAQLARQLRKAVNTYLRPDCSE